ncbi:hypothetical protein [Streptomyces sp. I6]|uniref:hypothetical protein n=1 Tax=Streptomyces sp. I6 TaxID=2483113 RepID=UPI000F45A715|nr:hypothetical protein [Streptomyces sp. I6]RNL71200.1 hypothetical protein EBF04_09350 [Streptomyces sp. I6]
MISRARRFLFFGVATAAVAGASTFAFANMSQAAAAEETRPPIAVEDFAYPGAAKILQDRGLKLIKGDGHILAAACDESPNQIRIWTRVGDEADRFCFRATASTGHLTLEVPEVYALQTADHPISADLTAEGKSETVDVAKDDMVGVGEGLGNPPAVLVELRVTG